VLASLINFLKGRYKDNLSAGVREPLPSCADVIDN